jgi:tetratricopeptide (TPR) repeat protein
VSPAVRVRLVVGVAAAVAAGTVAGVVLATRQDPAQPMAQCAQAPKALIVPGVGDPQAATAVRRAFAAWPHRTLVDLEVLASRYPRDPVVQFNFGSVLFCAGFTQDALQAYRAAKEVGRDTQYRITADNLLHPQFFDQGYPIFEPTTRDPLLLRGSALQREGHQVSAERLYARAARLHPDDPEALTAAAVGRFDEDDLAASFSRLGPLTRRFPRSQTVRYHLGLLLLWIGEAKQGVQELETARRLGPGTALGREAERLVERIRQAGSARSGR